MLDALTEPFSSGIAQRALVETIVIGAACGPLGGWIVLYRQSYAAESIAHGMLPGLALASLSGIPLGLGAAAGLLVAAVAIALASRLPTIGADTAVGVTVTALFGTGALLALSPETPARLGELLFGDPLSIGTGELAISVAATLVLLAALAVLHRPLTLAGFDPQAAASFGARPARVELALIVLLGLTVFVAVQALGNLLVIALIVAPAAAASRLTRRLPGFLTTSAALAIASGVLGLYASHYLETAAGASIAIAAVLIFVLSLARRPAGSGAELRVAAAAPAAPG
jgi:ABC-type Mn2+/Zn2+ transport system permease subunit